MKTIKQYFDEQELSFDKIAKKHHVSRSYLNRIINGKVGCSMEHFVMIAEWVKMPRNDALAEWEARMCARIKKTAKENRI